MLSKTETRLLDRYFTIYGETFDKPTFYQAVQQLFPSWRGEQLHENDSYECYLENLTQNEIA